MKTFALAVVGLALALVLSAGADAQQCHVPTRTVHLQQAVAVQPVTPVFATQFVPIVVPAFTVGSSYGARDAGYAELVEELRKLRLEVAAMRQGQVGALGAEPVHVKALKAECASCHTGLKAKADFMLFEADGRMVGTLDTLQLGKMAANIATGDMPQGRAMAPQHKAAALKWIGDTLKTVKAEPKAAVMPSEK